jgi:hypothetical protein
MPAKQEDTVDICNRAPVVVNPVLQHARERRASLDGTWHFRLDPEDTGLAERWFEHGLFADEIQVPGNWQGQGFGGTGTETIWDFRLDVRSFRATYTGTGWYARRFSLPAGWQGARVWLNFGGVHPTADVWMNGVKLGENHAPFVPFGFEVTDLVVADRENLLVVRVSEQDRAMGMAFNWQGNWSGLYRGVELTATGSTYLDQVWLHPDVDAEQLALHVFAPGAADRTLTLDLRVEPLGGGGAPVDVELHFTTDRAQVEVPIPSPALWSPDTPNLYRVDVALLAEGELQDARSERVGFVKLVPDGEQLLINGEPYYWRGSGDFLSNPETGSPDTDRERWRRKLQVLRDYGYNYVRCQSYVYGREYYDAADEVGLLVQSEMGLLGSWSGHSQWHVYQWPQPMPDNYAALKAQWDRVVMRDVNHPSANMYCMSNEFGSTAHYPRIAWQGYRDTKAIKPTALIIWTDGGYHPDMPADFINSEAASKRRGDASGANLPLIQHEFRWWSSFPDVRNMGKYSGALRPYGAQVALEAAERNGIAHVLAQAAANSQRLQLLEAKGKMEACRRDNPTLAGICHFNAMDANPSPQGVVDEFYERKVADAVTWRETNGDTVVLASLGFDDRVLVSGERRAVTLSVSDYSHPPLEQPSLQWRLVLGDDLVASGELAYTHVAYRTVEAGEIAFDVPAVAQPCAGRLEVVLKEGERAFTNHWDLWAFPASAGEWPARLAVYGQPEYTWSRGVEGLPILPAGQAPDLSEVRAVLAERIDAPLVAFMRAGGRVVLAASEGLVRPFRSKLGLGSGTYFFTPPANYPPYEDGHDGTIIADHPILGDMPHEGFADLQFYRLFAEHPPLDMAHFGPRGWDPVFRSIHCYPVGRSLGYLAEGAVGAGALILCALNLDQALPEGRYLAGQLAAYAVGEELQPMRALDDASIERLVEATAIP